MKKNEYKFKVWSPNQHTAKFFGWEKRHFDIYTLFVFFNLFRRRHDKGDRQYEILIRPMKPTKRGKR